MAQTAARRASVALVALTALAGAATVAARAAGGPGAEAPLHLRVVGVRVLVTDLAQAERFYSRVCGFDLVRRAPDGRAALLRNGAVTLELRQAERRAAAHYPGDAEIHVNFEVRSIAATLSGLAAAGYRSLEGAAQPAAIGTYVTVQDPAGNIQQLLELAKAERPGERPHVFNLEVEVTEMKRARAFYVGQLGFAVETERFFPPTVPLKPQGPVPLVLQETARRTVEVHYPRDARTVIVLAADDLPAAVGALRRAGVAILAGERRDGAGSAVFEDPFGNVFALVRGAGTEGR